MQIEKYFLKKRWVRGDGLDVLTKSVIFLVAFSPPSLRRPPTSLCAQLVRFTSLGSRECLGMCGASCCARDNATLRRLVASFASVVLVCGAVDVSGHAAVHSTLHTAALAVAVVAAHAEVPPLPRALLFVPLDSSCCHPITAPRATVARLWAVPLDSRGKTTWVSSVRVLPPFVFVRAPLRFLLSSSEVQNNQARPSSSAQWTQFLRGFFVITENHMLRATDECCGRLRCAAWAVQTDDDIRKIASHHPTTHEASTTLRSTDTRWCTVISASLLADADSARQ